MSRITSRGASDTSRVVERQMRNWELSRAQRDAPLSAETGVSSFFTVSRMVAAGGSGLATLLSERTGWPAFDKEILHRMSDDDSLRERIYHSLDERDVGWLEEMLRSLIHSEWPRNDYMHRLTETVLGIARGGSAIFVGRATDLILPRGVGTRVRVVAPVESRVRRYADQHGLSPEESRKAISETEAERARFVERHFGRSADDPCRFDLVINTDRLELRQAVELCLSSRIEVA